MIDTGLVLGYIGIIPGFLIYHLKLSWDESIYFLFFCGICVYWLFFNIKTKKVKQ